MSRCKASPIASLDHSLSPFPPELPGQLTVKTSSSKKRKLARPLTNDLDDPTSPSPDTAIPSCEPDDDVALSFSATPIASGLEAPLYVRAGSVTASSVPPRLQTQAQAHVNSSLVSADYASSVASSPGASFYHEPSIDSSERGGDDAASVQAYARSQSPFLISKRAIMNGDAELPQRSSSPLKRRASSMDPETIPDKNIDAASSTGDVEMTSSSHSSAQLPRAMSVDVTEVTDTEPLTNGTDTSSAQCKFWCILN